MTQTVLNKTGNVIRAEINRHAFFANSVLLIIDYVSYLTNTNLVSKHTKYRMLTFSLNSTNQQRYIMRPAGFMAAHRSYTHTGREIECSCSNYRVVILNYIKNYFPRFGLCRKYFTIHHLLALLRLVLMLILSQKIVRQPCQLLLNVDN
jgi:hypothetical protein